jgi:arabinogalactan oligomer/maltooligosaccharide transport system permease protein
MVFGILIVAALAGTIRWHALTTLNVDYDEDDYLRAAQQYTTIIRAGDWDALKETNYRSEHPPLAKIVFGISLLPLPEKTLIADRPTSAGPNQYLPRDLLRNARITSAIFGTLTAALVALVDPVGGFFLAIHAFTTKYVSQVMLEALPAFTSILSAFFYIQWKKRRRKEFAWLIASGLFLGLTAASKYIYCVVGIAIIIDWMIVAIQSKEIKKTIIPLLGWGLFSIVVFFAANPYFWADPFGRIKETLVYYSSYSTTATEVTSAGYPFWQPLVYLFSTPKSWQPNAILVAVDPLITLFAILGFKSQLKKQSLYSIWVLVALVFLFIYPVKWAQYVVILTAPLCIMAGEGFKNTILIPILNWLSQIRITKSNSIAVVRYDTKKALPWLIPGIIVFVLFTILPLIFEVGVSLTDFNSISIKDGFEGGIFREVWGAFTGKIQSVDTEFPFREKMVSFIGTSAYPIVLRSVTDNGILFFNLFWTVASVGLQTMLGLLAALLLKQKKVFMKKGWEILFILPWAIPEMIGALMWVNVFQPETGWLSLGVSQYGTSFPFSFLNGWQNSSSMQMLVLLIAGVWYGFPFMMLAASAGLKLLPKEVYDAAAIDGANGIKVFRWITWPMLVPLLVPAVIIRSIFAFNQFYLFQVFPTGQLTLAGLSYNLFNPSGFFINGQFAISAVINVITVVILVIFVVILNKWSNASEGVTYA